MRKQSLQIIKEKYSHIDVEKLSQQNIDSLF